jgi:ribonuclease HI
MANKKYYVVWKGHNPGVYDNWNDCKTQVDGFDSAKYKSFPTKEEADKALADGHKKHLKTPKTPQQPWEKPAETPIPDSLSVDAACSGNPGNMEYRGVITASRKEIFHIGPLPQGTNNIGEFLAIVHALALLKQKNSPLPIYTDSLNAIKWVNNKKCKTLLAQTPLNAPIFALIDRAERWLQNNTYTTRILKWQTTQWGEIPADFGRK